MRSSFICNKCSDGLRVKCLADLLKLSPTVSPVKYLADWGKGLGSGGQTPQLFTSLIVILTLNGENNLYVVMVLAISV